MRFADTLCVRLTGAIVPLAVENVRVTDQAFKGS